MKMKSPKEKEIIIAIWYGKFHSSNNDVMFTSEGNWVRGRGSGMLGVNIKGKFVRVWGRDEVLGHNSWAPIDKNCVEGKWGAPDEFGNAYMIYSNSNINEPFHPDNESDKSDKSDVDTFDIKKALLGENKNGCECGAWTIAGANHSSYCKLYGKDK